MPNRSTLKPLLDFKAIFTSLPGLYLVLSPDLRVITANNSFLKEELLTNKKPEGVYLFDILHNSSNKVKPNIHVTLRQSFDYVLANKQKHVIKRLCLLPQEPGIKSQVKYWSVTNTPVLNEADEINYIILELNNTTLQVQPEEPNSILEDLQGIPKATKDVIRDWNLQNNMLWWNDGFSTLYGYDLSEVEPDISSWKNIIHPDDLEPVTGTIHHAIDKGEEVWQATYRFRCADGSYKIILDHGYLIKDAHGKAIRMVGAMQDKTGELQIEQKLREQTAHTTQLLESLPLMLWTATPDGSVNYYNQQWFDYTGATFESMKEWNWRNFIHPSDYEETRRCWLKSIATGEPFVIENRWKSAKENTYRWFLAKAVPLRDNLGNITLWVGSNTDIEQQKQVQEKLASSEKQFRFLAESIPQMVWSANPDGYIDYTNHRWYDYVRMDESSSLGFGWAPVIHPEEVDNLMITWMNCVATGEKLELQVRFQDAAAETYRWFLLRAEPMRSETGEIIKWFGTATDIEEYRKHQLLLQQANDKYHFLTNAIPQIIWTSEPNGIIDYLSDQGIRYCGFPNEAEALQKWITHVHPDDIEESMNRMVQALTTGLDFQNEYRIRRHDGEYRWHLSRAIAMRDTKGNILKWFGVCTDIEDHKKAEEELVEKNLELERTNQDLDSFVYSASHDLKLPILNMAGIFEELIRVTDFKDPDAYKMIGMFRKSLKQIQTTIDDLSGVVRIQKAGKREPEYLSFEETIQNVLVSLQHPINSSQATIITDFSEAPFLHFTRPGLKSILYNLLSNAIKYKAENRPPVVHISTKIKDNFVELRVTDNGIGLDTKRHQNKLFQMFKRFHNHVNGSGLGLYIVNRLVTNHGGYISIESRLNEGTTFYLYFKQRA